MTDLPPLPTTLSRCCECQELFAVPDLEEILQRSPSPEESDAPTVCENCLPVFRSRMTQEEREEDEADSAEEAQMLALVWAKRCGALELQFKPIAPPAP